MTPRWASGVDTKVVNEISPKQVDVGLSQTSTNTGDLELKVK